VSNVVQNESGLQRSYRTGWQDWTLTPFPIPTVDPVDRHSSAVSWGTGRIDMVFADHHFDDGTVAVAHSWFNTSPFGWFGPESL
jgi:hypothetical protein